MGFGFVRLCNYLWRRITDKGSDSTILSSSSDFPSTDHDFTRFQSRRVERKWPRNREERSVTVDGEYDMVIVPSDCGCCGSGSESHGSDWSVGWMEPHAPEFQADSGDTESDFVVLVPCYNNGGFEKKTGSRQNGFYYGEFDLMHRFIFMNFMIYIMYFYISMIFL
ncbi:hypothetical protein KSP40_PGU017324 [Platanthera guangdongensis]|uniref:Uncharacterized protein n=1 Tax=Platanthera guangdongensis TaxID=2320717 RepID=A0ABR2MXD9_9ASPA